MRRPTNPDSHPFRQTIAIKSYDDESSFDRSRSGSITDDGGGGDTAKTVLSGLNQFATIFATSLFTSYPVKAMHGEGGEEKLTFIFFLENTFSFFFKIHPSLFTNCRLFCLKLGK